MRQGNGDTGVANPVAELRVPGDDRILVASECEIAPPFVHVTGRWRRRRAGGEGEEFRWSEWQALVLTAEPGLRVRWLNRTGPA